MLVRSGRNAEAKAAYRQAIEAIDGLPVSRRSSRAYQDLSRQFHRRLRQLNDTE